MSVSHRKSVYVRIMFCLAVVSSLAACNFKWGHINYNTGYQPDQPIPFSHELHAGQYQVPCTYCHTNVERSNHATVPSLNICMNCHMIVKADSPHIQQLQEKYFAGETVEWVKVHMMPEFVKFNHSAHVLNLADADNRQQSCSTCHGDVASMDVVEQVESLSMGWCVQCHREPEHNAPLNCSTCHH